MSSCHWILCIKILINKYNIYILWNQYVHLIVISHTTSVLSASTSKWNVIVKSTGIHYPERKNKGKKNNNISTDLLLVYTLSCRFQIFFVTRSAVIHPLFFFFVSFREIISDYARVINLLFCGESWQGRRAVTL